MSARRVAILTAVLAVLAVVARMRLQPEADAIGGIRNPAWLPSGKALRTFSMGERLLLADVYWLRAVQYMGQTLDAKVDRWQALYPLADIVTDLDPRDAYVYQVVGSNLGGIAHRYAEADRILEKGMKNLPDRWSLPWIYAVNKFLYQGDFATAARYAKRAGEVGHRPHLALLAANLWLASGRPAEYAAAEQFVEEAIRAEKSPDVRAQLVTRLVKVRTYAALDRVERAIAAFEASYVRAPFALEELVADGFLPAIPPDPAGGRILYDLATGKVRSSVLGERRPVKDTEATP